MAVFSPNGLKIRLSPQICFGLIARLPSDVPASRVFDTTEALEELPTAFGYAAALLCFLVDAEPIVIAIATAIAVEVGVLVTMFGLFVIPGLVPFARFFANNTGRGLDWIAILVIAVIAAGWLGVLAYLAGRLFGFLLRQATEYWRTKRSYDELGRAVTMSEINFINAYRIHAREHDLSTDPSLADPEFADTHWGPRLVEYRSAHPQAVQYGSESAEM